jgi:hypothetical protein
MPALRINRRPLGKYDHEMRTVTLAFHKVEDHWDKSHVWQTRLSRMLVGEYVHVDVLFEDGMATSIMNNESVYFQKRTLKNKDKKMVALSVTPVQYESMRRFARKCAQDQIPFNAGGFYRCALPLVWRRCDDKKYFCSEYAVRMLQFAGRCMDVEPGNCNPTQLRELIAPYCAATPNPTMLASATLSTTGMTGRTKPGHSTRVIAWPKFARANQGYTRIPAL